jgi:hypothetical protein
VDPNSAFGIVAALLKSESLDGLLRGQGGEVGSSVEWRGYVVKSMLG